MFIENENIICQGILKIGNTLNIFYIINLSSLFKLILANGFEFFIHSIFLNALCVNPIFVLLNVKN